MNMLYSCVLYLDAGGRSRDVSLVLYVTLCLLWLSDESKSFSLRSNVSASLPVSSLHAQVAESLTFPVGC